MMSATELLDLKIRTLKKTQSFQTRVFSEQGIEGRAGVVDRNAQPVEWQGRPILQLTP